MKLLLYAFLVLCSTPVAAAETLTAFLSHPQPIKLAAFMDFRELSPDVRDEFQSFYYDIVNNMRNMRSARKKNQMVQKLKEQGMNSLEIKHPQWAREVTTILQKTDHPLYNAAHIFVIRSAALESFYEHKAHERSSTWAKLRGFVDHTKQTIVEWFSFLHPKKTVV